MKFKQRVEMYFFLPYKRKKYVLIVPTQSRESGYYKTLYHGYGTQDLADSELLHFYLKKTKQNKKRTFLTSRSDSA